MRGVDRKRPYRIRMYAESGCDFALWGDPRQPLPATGEEEAEDLERALPISKSLRSRLFGWADQYFRYDGGERDLDMADFDERGMLLSRELQRELWPAYSVRYSFTSSRQRERLLALVADDPCPGWSVK